MRLTSALTGTTIALMISCVFLYFVSLENFGSLLLPSISENGFLDIFKFLTHNIIVMLLSISALSTAYTMIVVFFSGTRLGGNTTKITVFLSSIAVSTLISWIGRQSEFANGQLFRSATESYADPVRMFVFVAVTSITFTLIFILLLLALKAILDLSKTITK